MRALYLQLGLGLRVQPRRGARELLRQLPISSSSAGVALMSWEVAFTFILGIAVLLGVASSSLLS